MEKIKNIIKSLTVATLLTGVAMNFNACSEQSPVASNADNQSHRKTLNILKLSGGNGALNKRVTASKTFTPRGGGQMFLKAGVDADLILMLKKRPPLKSAVVARRLVKASPLSSAVLHAMLDRKPSLRSAHLRKVLKKNLPLSESVLMHAMQSRALSMQALAYLLIESSPLSADILTLVGRQNFTPKQLRRIRRAQKSANPPPAKVDDYGEGSVFVQMAMEPGSINEPLEISVSVDDEEISGDVFLTFGPHGTVFNKPIKLNIELHGLDLSGIQEDALAIYYTNGETGQWELMESKNIIVKKRQGYIKVVQAELPHFSRYAIGAE